MWGYLREVKGVVELWSQLRAGVGGAPWVPWRAAMSRTSALIFEVRNTGAGYLGEVGPSLHLSVHVCRVRIVGMSPAKIRSEDEAEEEEVATELRATGTKSPCPAALLAPAIFLLAIRVGPWAPCRPPPHLSNPPPGSCLFLPPMTPSGPHSKPVLADGHTPAF